MYTHMHVYMNESLFCLPETDSIVDQPHLHLKNINGSLQEERCRHRNREIRQVEEAGQQVGGESLGLGVKKTRIILVKLLEENIGKTLSYINSTSLLKHRTVAFLNNFQVGQFKGQAKGLLLTKKNLFSQHS